MKVFFLKRKKNIFWNSDFILVPCRASSLTIEMMFGFLISDKQNSRNQGGSGAPLFLCVPIGRCTTYYIQYISLKKFPKFVQMLIKMIYRL